MAVFRPAAPFADLRGSIGQTTFGRNGYGLFARARTAPDDSDPSAEQLAIRQNMRDVAAAYATISDASRKRWRDLAARTSLPNALGDCYTPTAWQLFAKRNLFLLFLGYAINTTAPTSAISASSPFCYSYDAVNGIRLTSAGQRVWAGTCRFQLSYPLSLNRYFCKGPWQPGLDVNKVEAWFSTLPQTVFAVGLLTASKAYFVRSRILNSTGSISFPQITRIQTTT